MKTFVFVTETRDPATGLPVDTGVIVAPDHFVFERLLFEHLERQARFFFHRFLLVQCGEIALPTTPGAGTIINGPFYRSVWPDGEVRLCLPPSEDETAAPPPAA